MAILGPHTLLDNNMPSGVDWTMVTNFNMREGMSVEEAIALANTVAGQANEEALAPWRSIIYITEELFAEMEQGNGTRTMTPLGTEFADEDGVIAEEVGHMLSITKYKDAVGWSVDFLREARRSRLVSSLNLIKMRWLNRVDYEAVWRLLRTDEVVVGGGYSPGWAVGTGTNTDYIPPQWMTEVHDSTHTHYGFTNAAATAANILTAIETGAAELTHHGHTGPKVAIVANNLATLLLASNDKRIALYTPESFRLLAGSTSAPIATIPGQVEGVPGETIAVINTSSGLVMVKRHPRFPSGYLWVGKTYGDNNPANPLVIRTDELWGGFGLKPRMEVTSTIPADLKSVQFEGKHGFNVGDRTAGYSHYVAADGSSYPNPTIQG